MKYLAALFLASLFLSASVQTGEKPTKNEYVDVTISIKQKSLKPGTAGELLISFKPKRGIHINLDPPLSVKIDSSEFVASVGKLDTLRDARTAYLDVAKPVRQLFTLSKKIKPGTVTIRGLLTYFYCSDAEGWCSRFKQPIEVSVPVVR